jgi:hypothetical protein
VSGPATTDGATTADTAAADGAVAAGGGATADGAFSLYCTVQSYHFHTRLKCWPDASCPAAANEVTTTNAAATDGAVAAGGGATTDGAFSLYCAVQSYHFHPRLKCWPDVSGPATAD